MSVSWFRNEWFAAEQFASEWFGPVASAPPTPGGGRYFTYPMAIPEPRGARRDEKRRRQEEDLLVIIL